MDGLQGSEASRNHTFNNAHLCTMTLKTKTTVSSKELSTLLFNSLLRYIMKPLTGKWKMYNYGLRLWEFVGDGHMWASLRSPRGHDDLGFLRVATLDFWTPSTSVGRKQSTCRACAQFRNMQIFEYSSTLGWSLSFRSVRWNASVHTYTLSLMLFFFFDSSVPIPVGLAPSRPGQHLELLAACGLPCEVCVCTKNLDI